MPRLEWSSETPRVDGYYWIRRPGKTDAIMLVWDSCKRLVCFGAQVSRTGESWNDDVKELADRGDCLWKGPLTEDEPG